MSEETEYKKPQKYLGPSQFATALGFSQFKTPETLKKELEEGCYRKVRPQMAFGTENESVCIYCYRKKTGQTVIKPKWKTYRKNFRIGGVCDGFIIDDASPYVIKGLLEIKCHPGQEVPMTYVPIYYLVQITGYMAIYKAPWCDFMSCCFDEKTNALKSYHITRVYWKDVQDRWENEWFPELDKFITEVNWKYAIPEWNVLRYRKQNAKYIPQSNEDSSVTNDEN